MMDLVYLKVYLDHKSSGKRKTSSVFKMCGLSIIVTTNITSADFLDVTFNLKTESYQPFRKPNNEPKYIDISSNHPPQVLKQLPKSIEKRLSEISSSKETFGNSKHLHEKAVQESGFKEKLCYQQKDVKANSNRSKKKKRQRKIIWFNPPLPKSVKTNLSKEFFKLLKRHFPKHYKMSKIFNKNTVKLNYSCCRNINSKISSNNRKIIIPPPTNYGCNCRNRSNCPLDNKCLAPSIV